MIKAIADRVMVRLEDEPKSDHLIIDTPFTSRTIGKVESVGERVTSVKEGDKILFRNQQTGTCQ